MEEGEIEGIIPAVVMNELLHNLILVELVGKNLQRPETVQSAGSKMIQL
ncbi:MAG: hypothetical protein NTV68_01230 [Methanomicrobiales archaeon]|nr:hypothetical protein [Methanomicrobiales archaeon]